MKNLLLILTLSHLFFSCSSPTVEKDISQINIAKDSSADIPNINVSIDTQNCDYVYDTIRNGNYQMHLRILEKFYDKSKRGYYFTQDGDTLNEFLYHQDIHVFISNLDSNETGIYFLLTNRVVNLIISKEPKMLDAGLPNSNEKNFSYFIKHVGNQICGDLNLVEVIRSIQTNMRTPNDRAKTNKRIIIEKLEKEKTKR